VGGGEGEDRGSVVRDHVALDLRELQTAEQLDALSRGRIDVGVIRGPLQSTTLAPGLELAVIHREHLVAALPETHALARQTRLRAAQLRGERFVILHRSEAPGLWAPLASVMGSVGGVPENVLEVAEMQTIIGLVASGLGVSLVPASVSETDSPGVTFRPLADPSPPIELSLAWAREGRSPTRDAFLALAAANHPTDPLKVQTPRGF